MRKWNTKQALSSVHWGDANFLGYLNKRDSWQHSVRKWGNIGIGLAFFGGLAVGIIDAIALSTMLHWSIGLVICVGLGGFIAEGMVYLQGVKTAMGFIFSPPGPFKRLAVNLEIRELKKSNIQPRDMFDEKWFDYGDLNAYVHYLRSRYHRIEHHTPDDEAEITERDWLLVNQLLCQGITVSQTHNERYKGIKKKLSSEILTKQILLAIAFGFALGNAVGFAAITFTHASIAFASIGLSSGAVLALSGALAVLAGLAYGLMMFLTLSQAIENNIFKQIARSLWHCLKPTRKHSAQVGNSTKSIDWGEIDAHRNDELNSCQKDYEEGKINWFKLQRFKCRLALRDEFKGYTKMQCVAYALSRPFVILGFLAVALIAVVVPLATGGEWYNGCVTAFHRLWPFWQAASKVAVCLIFIVFVPVNIVFVLKNSWKSFIDFVANLSWQRVKKTWYMARNPKHWAGFIVGFLVALAALTFHVIGEIAFASEGTIVVDGAASPGKLFIAVTGFVTAIFGLAPSPMVAAQAADAIAEILTDLHFLVGDAEDHDHDEADHDHGSIIINGVQLAVYGARDALFSWQSRKQFKALCVGLANHCLGDNEEDFSTEKLKNKLEAASVSKSVIEKIEQLVLVQHDAGNYNEPAELGKIIAQAYMQVFCERKLALSHAYTNTSGLSSTDKDKLGKFVQSWMKADPSTRQLLPKEDQRRGSAQSNSSNEYELLDRNSKAEQAVSADQVWAQPLLPMQLVAEKAQAILKKYESEDKPKNADYKSLWQFLENTAPRAGREALGAG